MAHALDAAAEAPLVLIDRGDSIPTGSPTAAGQHHDSRNAGADALPPSQPGQIAGSPSTHAGHSSRGNRDGEALLVCISLVTMLGHCRSPVEAHRTRPRCRTGKRLPSDAGKLARPTQGAGSGR